ncbi:hypothetical protein SNARM312S_07501 [Streptomyces narbonensis]
MPVSTVAPAALASTFATSVVGACTYALLSLTHSGTIAPDWPLGLACGLGGLIGGYLGARLSHACRTPSCAYSSGPWPSDSARSTRLEGLL